MCHLIKNITFSAFQISNANKKCVFVDLKKQKVAHILFQLVFRSDY